MALVAACTNTRNRNPKRKLSGNSNNNNNQESNKLPLISNSINLQMAIPALNSQNGIISSRKGAVGSLNNELIGEKNQSTNISAQGSSLKKETKKTVKTVPFRPFRKSVRLLIRKRGTTNLSGKSTCSDIPEPVTLPRTVEFFSDVHKIHDDPEQSAEGTKLLFLAGLGMYRNLDALGLEYRRQVLQEQYDKFEAARPKVQIDSSLDFSNNSYYEDVDYEIKVSPLPPPRTPSPPPSNSENSVSQTTETETEIETEQETEQETCQQVKGKNENTNWDVNMTVLLAPVGSKLVEDEVVIKPAKSEMPSTSTDLNKNECTLASSTQLTIKTSNVNNIVSEEEKDWLNFDRFMKDQLAQELIKCPPKKVNKQEIEDAKRKLILLREQWGI